MVVLPNREGETAGAVANHPVSDVEVADSAGSLLNLLRGTSHQVEAADEGVDMRDAERVSDEGEDVDDAMVSAAAVEGDA